MVLVEKKIDNRYDIRSIVGQGGMGIVYSAYDRLTGDVVALKNVRPEFYPKIDETTASIADFRVALAQEFSVLATLRHPYIISVLDFGFDFSKQPYFTMTLLKESKNIVEYAKSLPLEQKVELVIQMMEAIHYLHRRGVLHRDLKPENVSIQNGQVKVLDFGVAKMQNKEGFEPEDMFVGTLAYMAPESFGIDYTDDLARLSDIYAAGLIIYEVFLGVFPYDNTNINTLMEDISYRIPDVTPFSNFETALDTYALADIVSKMLEKDPFERYHSTDAVLADFYKILGHENQSSIEVRESLLQNAIMVGRNEELHMLDSALKLSFTEQGSVWLVGGESGVGKSRLIEELRVRALVRGALVVRGQSVSEANAPYEVWRDVLSRLLLELDIDPLQASVLKPLVGDIDRIMGYDVPDAPDIGAVASYNRLLTVITEILSKYNRELVIILEDLHWASESLNLLRQIIPHTQNNPIIIIGTYRSDERPNLPQNLQGAEVLLLDNLSQSAISAFAEAIVGNLAGQTTVVDLLQSKTNGNVMFIIEVLRALIEEFGALDKINLNSLPSDMFGDGIQAVIRYRLRKLPENHYAMLQMSAIIGKVIDLKVMKHIYGDDSVSEWLQAGEEALLLKVRNNRWQFSNNAVRDTLEADTTPSDWVKLHTCAAEVIEALYDTNEDAVRLAYHWAEAGNVLKEAHYKDITAEQAYDSSAFKEASEDLERLLELHEAGQIQVERLKIAHYYRMLGACYLELGEISESLATLTKAVGISNPPVPQGLLLQGLGTAWEVLRQTWHRIAPYNRVLKSPQKHAELTESALALNQVSEIILAYQPEQIIGIYASIRVLNMAEKLGAGYSLAFSYAGVALLTSTIGMKGMAETYLKLAHKTLEHDLSKSARAVSTFPMAIVYAGWGHWEQAQALLEECLRLSDEIGDWREWRQATGLVGDIYHFKGDYETAIDKYTQAYISSQRVQHTSQMAIQLAIRSRSLFMIGRYDEAFSLASEALELDSDTPMVSLNAMPVHLLTTLRHENWDLLYKQALILSEKTAQNPIKIYVQFDGYSVAVEAWLALLVHQSDEDIRQRLKTACSDLMSFGKTYPIGMARAKIFEARRLYLSSEVAKAIPLAEEGLVLARKFGMPYEEGLAHMVLGRINSDASQLAQAQSLFESIDHQWGLHQLNHLDI